MRNTPQRDVRLPTTSASDSSPADLKRRRLLFALGAGSAATAAAAAQSIAAPVASPTPASAAPASSGYRETEHVRDYYASTRI